MSGEAGYGAVLAVVDGSPASEITAEIGAEVAERTGGTLHIVAAPGFEQVGTGADDATVGAQSGTPEIAEGVGERLGAVARSIAERWDCSVETAVITPDLIPGGLAEYEAREGVGLTVAAAPTEDSPSSRLGSGRVVRPEATDGLPGPVLLLPVREEARRPDGFSLSDPDPLAVLLGPSDTNADASLPAHAARFAEVSGAELWLVDSSPVGSLLELDTIDPARPQPMEMAVEQRERLREMTARLRERGLNAHHELIDVHEAGEAQRALDDFLRDRGIGTVAVGPEGRTLAGRLTGGGTPREAVPAGSSGPTVAVLLCPAAPPV